MFIRQWCVCHPQMESGWVACILSLARSETAFTLQTKADTPVDVTDYPRAREVSKSFMPPTDYSVCQKVLERMRKLRQGVENLKLQERPIAAGRLQFRGNTSHAAENMAATKDINTAQPRVLIFSNNMHRSNTRSSKNRKATTWYIFPSKGNIS